MSELIIPILLKQNLIDYHKITHYKHFNRIGKMVTGSLGGELVVWNT